MRVNRVPVIYLAGDTGADWQDRVIEELGGPAPAIFIAPRDARCGIEAVRRADIVFSYLELSTASFPRLLLEIGFAAAMSEALPEQRKTILLVCDPHHPYGRFFGPARLCSDAVLSDLDAGIKSLKKVIHDFLS